MPVNLPVLTAIRTCAMDMLENAMYVERELPRLSLPSELQAQILDVTSSLSGTKHDVIDELIRIDELQDMGASQSDAIARVPLIMSWLAQDIAKLHSLVASLKAAHDRHPEIGAAHVLVMESATNILRSYAAACQAFQPEPQDPTTTGEQRSTS
jgi:hypothetical protein